MRRRILTLFLIVVSAFAEFSLWLAACQNEPRRICVYGCRGSCPCTEEVNCLNGKMFEAAASFFSACRASSPQALFASARWEGLPCCFDRQTPFFQNTEFLPFLILRVARNFALEPPDPPPRPMEFCSRAKS